MDLRRAIMMATDCMEYHGLYRSGWQFKLDNAKRRMGVCYRQTRVISISKPYTLVNSEDVILDTILHEIAHALAPAGVHHGFQWKLIAAQVGATPKACGGQEVTRVASDWEGHCHDCGAIARRHRQPGPRMLRSAYHVPCKFKTNGGKMTWKYKTVVLKHSP